MKICVLASGSKGNCTYVETKHTRSLIDLGMSNLYIEKKLISLNIDPDTIDNIFITHTHIDHIAGLKVFIKKHNPKVFLTNKMYDELKETVDFKDYEIIEDKILLDDLIVDYFKTSHDTSDSLGYIFISGDKSCVYVTDTGYINSKNFQKISNKNVYIFESNHDVEKLMKNNNYPYHTKQRILGDKGHLSNEQSSDYLKKIVGNITQNIILAHLSEQNNDPEIAYNTLRNKLDSNINIIIAKQDEKTEVVEV